MSREPVPGLAGWILAKEHGLHLPPSPDASGSPSQETGCFSLAPKATGLSAACGKEEPLGQGAPHPARLGDKELMPSLGHKEQAHRVLSLGPVQRAHPRDRVPIWRPPPPSASAPPPCHGSWQL